MSGSSRLTDPPAPAPARKATNSTLSALPGRPYPAKHLAAPRARGDREALRVLLTAREDPVIGRTNATGLLKSLVANGLVGVLGGESGLLVSVPMR